MFEKFDKAPIPVQLDKEESLTKESLPNAADVSVEESANFEGNDAELLISRLRHPDIKQQIVNIILDKELDKYFLYKNEHWEPYLPEGWTGEERFTLFKGKESGKIISSEDYENELNSPEPSIEEIEKELDAKIDEIEKQTNIDFSTNEPNSEVIPLNWKVAWTGEKATERQMSIIELHEKGHEIRSYHGLESVFQQGFDLSKVNFTQSDYDIHKENEESSTGVSLDNDKPLSLEEKKDQYLKEYLFTANEIAERMSQLKNYFGFRGAEEFTSEHLAYAREHYIEDTKMDNSMRLFFEAITPETEKAFLEIINNYGI